MKILSKPLKGGAKSRTNMQYGADMQAPKALISSTIDGWTPQIPSKDSSAAWLIGMRSSARAFDHRESSG
jgi:hypothetical protein